MCSASFRWIVSNTDISVHSHSLITAVQWNNRRRGIPYLPSGLSPWPHAGSAETKLISYISVFQLLTFLTLTSKAIYINVSHFSKFSSIQELAYWALMLLNMVGCWFNPVALSKKQNNEYLTCWGVEQTSSMIL